MHPSTLIVILIFASSFFCHSTNASGDSIGDSNCSQPFTDMFHQKNLTKCKKLTTLEAEFAWNYRVNDTGKLIELEVLVGTTVITSKENGWFAWGVNPEMPRMVGTRAIIGLKLPNYQKPIIDTYNITGDTKRGCTLRPSKSVLRAHDMSADYNDSTGLFTIFARLILPAKYYNISSLNIVWQVGHHVDGSTPLMHRTTLQNFDSKGRLNLVNGRSRSIFGHHRHGLRKVHGILNIIGWGTFLPIGVIIARYFRLYPFKNSWWFYLHVCCQTAGFVIGTIGWGIGLGLGHSSRFYSFHVHRILAICIFAFTTLQLLAFRLIPTKEDEYRKHWNLYHHFLGYALIAIITVNIFQGIDILKPRNVSWKRTYIGILVALAMVFLALEIYTWIKFLVSKKVKKGRNNKPLAPPPSSTSG